MAGSPSCLSQLSAKQNEIATRILKEIRDRLRFLIDVGLDYLALSRNSGTLSGGESQRIRLASQIGSGLTGVLYVLDEPSIGLHQRDNARLLETLKHLRDLGNTVIVVEHDEDAILPGRSCGRYRARCGGAWRARSSPRARRKRSWPTASSLTGQYLSGARQVAVPQNRRKSAKKQSAEASPARPATT